MTANANLLRVRESGWRRGFRNLLYKENRDWWRSRRWWIHLLIWTLMLNLTLTLSLSTPDPDPNAPPAFASNGDFIPPVDPVKNGLSGFVGLSAYMVILGAVIVAQNTIIDEKKTGTAAWVMSKPVSRTAFVAAKLLGTAFSALLIMVVIQWALAYVQISLRAGEWLPVGMFLAGMGIIVLNTLFFITLTMMVSTFTTSRSAVLAIPVAVLIVQTFIAGFVPSVARFLPITLIAGFGTVDTGPQPAVISNVMEGLPIASISPLLVCALCILVFVVLSIWRFRREEF